MQTSRGPGDSIYSSIMKPYMMIAAVVALLLAVSCAAPAPEPAPVVPSGLPDAVMSPARLPERIDYPTLSRLMAEPGSRLLVLDVRTAEEYATGHVPGAVLAPYDAIEREFREADKARPIVVYCRSGRRSALARQTLLAMGFVDVSDFGAVDNWLGGLVTD